jgi:hypothetical protein
MSGTEVPAPGAAVNPPAQSPRSALLPPPYLWFLAHPKLQGLVSHPKIQWAVTHLGIRRWLTLRRWPPVLFASMFTGSVMERVPGPHWRQDLIQAAMNLAVVAAALATDAYLNRRAQRLRGERSRLTYLAMATVPLAAAVGCFYAVSVCAFGTFPYDVFMIIGELSAWTALLTLGRALAYGPFRRLCWIYPPANRPPVKAHDVS